MNRFVDGMGRVDIPDKEDDKLESLKIWLYVKLDQLATTRNIVEKGMYSAYEECLKMVEKLAD